MRADLFGSEHGHVAESREDSNEAAVSTDSGEFIVQLSNDSLFKENSDPSSLFSILSRSVSCRLKYGDFIYF